ncbi:MAG: hypothetical protein ACRDT6_13070 [Micromonosporaceae bacterium]
MTAFDAYSTLAGYAHAAVDLKARMLEAADSAAGRRYVRLFLEAGRPAVPLRPEGVDSAHRVICTALKVGEPYVLSPAMTAIVAAAADALDLTDEVIGEDEAPTDHGVLFLPEPICFRAPNGQVTSFGAITWSKIVNHKGQVAYGVNAWSDPDDPLDPSAYASCRGGLDRGAQRARPVPAQQDRRAADRRAHQSPRICRPRRRGRAGLGARPGRAVLHRRRPSPNPGGLRDRVRVLAHRRPAPRHRGIATAGQSHPPPRRPRIHRPPHPGGGLLRRTRAANDRDAAADPTRRYRVRFVVRCHWRRLTDKDGRGYRIWIHSYIKGPDGAPLLTGEKVNILAR